MMSQQPWIPRPARVGLYLPFTEDALPGTTPVPTGTQQLLATKTVKIAQNEIFAHENTVWNCPL